MIHERCAQFRHYMSDEGVCKDWSKDEEGGEVGRGSRHPWVSVSGLGYVWVSVLVCNASLEGDVNGRQGCGVPGMHSSPDSQRRLRMGE